MESNDEWLAAQRDLDAAATRRAEERARDALSSGRSLFDTLEANKAAKQEAFEEASRLKNQFRALDEDEVEFLDSVLERTRAEEERVRKETQEGLFSFRQQQAEADKKTRGGGIAADADGPFDGAHEHAPAGQAESWVVDARKRKRARDMKEVLRGVKIRRPPMAETATPTTPLPGTKILPETSASVRTTNTLPSSRPLISKVEKKPPVVSKGALVNYASEEDDQ